MKTTLKLSAVAVIFLLSGCDDNNSQAPGDCSGLIIPDTILGGTVATMT